MVVRTGEKRTESGGDGYQMWLCLSNNTSNPCVSTGLGLNREILILAGGGGLGGGE